MIETNSLLEVLYVAKTIEIGKKKHCISFCLTEQTKLNKSKAEQKIIKPKISVNKT